MQIADFFVRSNEKIASQIYRMRLTPEAAVPPPLPGQFVNIQLDGFYLRRPISVCDWEGDCLTLIYKIVGEGTKRLAGFRPDARLNLLVNLGNGYTLVDAGRPALVGGGVGVPPLYLLAKALVQAGRRPVAILGFHGADDVFYREEFSALCDTIVTTEDGAVGTKGFVTDALANISDYDALYSCGPEAMLRALYTQANPLPAGHAQFSFERRMGCGFGACMVCSCKTVAGYKRVCVDGPILRKEEIQWS